MLDIRSSREIVRSLLDHANWGRAGKIDSTHIHCMTQDIRKVCTVDIRGSNMNIEDVEQIICEI